MHDAPSDLGCGMSRRASFSIGTLTHTSGLRGETLHIPRDNLQGTRDAQSPALICATGALELCMCVCMYQGNATSEPSSFLIATAQSITLPIPN
jgi:hypothetical protein